MNKVFPSLSAFTVATIAMSGGAAVAQTASLTATTHQSASKTVQSSAAQAAAIPASIPTTTSVVAPRTVRRTPIGRIPYAGFPGQPLTTITTSYGNNLVFNRGTGEASGFGPSGMTPWGQDWTGVRPHHVRKGDPFDWLKYVPLNESGSIWLSFSGETRLRNWFETRPVLGTKTPNDSGRFGVRNLYGADLHLGSHLRFFGQLVNGDAAGWAAYGYGTTYRKRLDVQQAFVELSGKFLGARAGFLFGRQQFLDAPTYLLYNRETPNVPLSWNGFRAYSIWSRFRIDAYDFVQTDDSQTGMFQDTENYKNRLYGVDMTWAPPDFRFLGGDGYSFLDLYYIGYKLAGSGAAIATATGSSSGSTTRNNFGGRYYGVAGPIEFSIGGTWQGGVFQYAGSNKPRSVNAFAVNTLVGYRLKLATSPFLGLQTDLYSGGDDARKTGGVGTFIVPFNPQTNYLDTTTYLSGSNLVSLAPLVRFSPFKQVSVQVKYPLLWRESTNDAVYMSSGRYTFAHQLHGGFIGMAPQASLTWQILPHVTWQQYVSRFMVSSSMARAGASSGTYYQSNFIFRF
ncbi:hypothetical protein AA23498_1598 [Acetobacter nitrogenifigens DSM 23921 = NBRC 105050]|uniref:Alginate export domain-containing protein n=2 Tax=Acetobacter nitrogenifigens TaxID=285268 RepID=A0A511XB62_9PROT|nr:alginate export family protein [Acetobacter nitrogenifigens]GBQ92967.1 hypothetical protein AA23498_1598 [Acetobacter nitrogenifigens DSM 23921 = NBRC 105050]GEN60180.1 hypothetical protein ANI02nite_20640 [Acetobacter nitrogenifigens DSM 23921 = NBRC 105050]